MCSAPRAHFYVGYEPYIHGSDNDTFKSPSAAARKFVIVQPIACKSKHGEVIVYLEFVEKSPGMQRVGKL